MATLDGAGAMPDDPGLRTVVDAGVMVITLDRPTARNAFTRAMLEALADALDEAAASDGVRVVVVTGAGAAFCAGGDVQVMAAGGSIFGDHDDLHGRTATQADLQRRTVVRLHELGKPTIAVLPGAAVGAGLALALACDLRYAAQSAVLATGFARVGLAGDFGCSWLLHSLASPALAREMLLRPRPLSADAARARGLVNEVFADDALREAADDIARSIAEIPPAAAARIVATARAVRALTLAEAADLDARTHVELTVTAEHRDAVRRLVESRRRS